MPSVTWRHGTPTFACASGGLTRARSAWHAPSVTARRVAIEARRARLPSGAASAAASALFGGALGTALSDDAVAGSPATSGFFPPACGTLNQTCDTKRIQQNEATTLQCVPGSAQGLSRARQLRASLVLRPPKCRGRGSASPTLRPRATHPRGVTRWAAPSRRQRRRGACIGARATQSEITQYIGLDLHPWQALDILKGFVHGPTVNYY